MARNAGRASGGKKGMSFTPKQSHGSTNAASGGGSGMYANRTSAPNSAGSVNYGQKSSAVHPATKPKAGSPTGGNSAPK